MSSLATSRVALRWIDRLAPPTVALVVTLALFLLISRVLDTTRSVDDPAPTIVAEIEMAPPPPQDAVDAVLPQLAPAPTLAAPGNPSPGLSLNASASEPALPAAPLTAGKVTISATLSSDDLGLGLGGNFAGFGGKGAGGAGSGGGGSGGGGGKAFDAKEVVPLSTARPQMPEWACRQKLRGWVEVSLIVTANGHVRDVRLVDADPRGVFEGAAIDSVSHWLYKADGAEHELRQRVEMLPEECDYNWK